MKKVQEERALQKHYECLGKQENNRLTAFDYNLRDLEIECAKQYISRRSKVLDVGSGPGLACFEYAKLGASVSGIDYAESMIAYANTTLHKEYADIEKNVTFVHGSVYELPFKKNLFDIITSHRVLIALLSWDNQKKALDEITKCLKTGGLYIMFEATVEGLSILNNFRKMFGLSEVSEGGDGEYERLLFSEQKLKEYMSQNYELVNVHSFGMYYFLTRILQPLFVAPDKPQYNHKLNDIAFEIAKKIPDFENIGHLKGYVWEKKG